MSDNARQEIGYVQDPDSSGWQHLHVRFKELADRLPLVKKRLQLAKIGFDFGSGIGQSAYALSLLCRNLKELHCVDNRQELKEPFKTALRSIVVEERQTMEEFVAAVSVNSKLVGDVIMMASMQGQPFFKEDNLRNLALSLKPEGILLEYNSDYPHEYNQAPMTDFFIPLHESREVNIWQRKKGITTPSGINPVGVL